MKKDNRIKYFRQENTTEVFENWYFILKKATTKYFVWSSVDDFMWPNFVEDNVRILEENEKIVGSISKIKYFDDDGLIMNREEFPYNECPINGTYEQRVRFYLRMYSAENQHAVFRTRHLKKCMVKKMIGADDAIILKILKFGEIFVSEDVSLYRYSYGISQSEDLFKRIRVNNGDNKIGLVFPFLPYTYWCLKNLGIKIFLKNLGFFYKRNEKMQTKIFWNLLSKLKKRIYRRKIRQIYHFLKKS